MVGRRCRSTFSTARIPGPLSGRPKLIKTVQKGVQKVPKSDKTGPKCKSCVRTGVSGQYLTFQPEWPLLRHLCTNQHIYGRNGPLLTILRKLPYESRGIRPLWRALLKCHKGPLLTILTLLWEMLRSGWGDKGPERFGMQFNQESSLYAWFMLLFWHF